MQQGSSQKANIAVPKSSSKMLGLLNKLKHKQEQTLIDKSKKWGFDFGTSAPVENSSVASIALPKVAVIDWQPIPIQT